MAEIKNYENYDVQPDGSIISYKLKSKGKLLKPQKASQSKKGYYQVRLFSETTPKGKLHYVHHLVWNAFKGEIPEGYEIDHKNTDTSNNSLDNLQLLTRKGNLEKYCIDRYGYNIRNHRDEIIKDYIELGSFQKVADKWGLGVVSIYRTIRNKVATRKNGKYTTKDMDNGIDDGFTKLELRNTEVRKQLGLPKISRKKTK